MKRFVCAVVAVVSAIFLVNIVTVPVNTVYAASEGQTATAKTAKTAGEDRIEKRIKKLHADLKITPAQEAQWNNVARVMRENHKDMEALTAARAKNEKNMTAVEDLKSYSQIIDAHAAALKKFIPTFEALYAGMSDDQKKNADKIFRGRTHKKAKGK